MDKSLEKEIIKGCRKKKSKSQEMLYKHFYGYAMSICLRYSYSKDEALEILNDSFMKVFNNIQKYNENLSFKSWLRRIIINTSIDYYRKNQKHRHTLNIEMARNEEYHLDIIDDLSVEDILKLLNELPNQYRIIFNLYEIEGYSHKEIAKMLDIPESTSRTNLARAKKKLRILFHQNFDYEIEYERAV